MCHSVKITVAIRIYNNNYDYYYLQFAIIRQNLVLKLIN